MQASNKMFKVGIAISFLGWAVAWFLEQGVIGALLFSLGFIVAVIGFFWASKDIVKSSLSKSSRTFIIPTSRIGLTIGLIGLGLSAFSGILSELVGTEQVSGVLFYLGLFLVIVAIMIFLYRFIMFRYSK